MATSNLEYARFEFQCGNDRSCELTVDLLVESNRLKPAFWTGGWCGNLTSDDVWPCVVLPDVRLDFGRSKDDDTGPEERFARFELTDRSLDLKKKLFFTINKAFGSCFY